MPFPLIPLLTAGGTLAGNLIGNAMQRHSAREQMRFQERMSNTAYQRMVRDMRKAGINPILGFGSGGASTPQGAQAQIGNPFEGVVSSASEANRYAIELRDIQRKESDSSSQRGTNVERNWNLAKQREIMDKQLAQMALQLVGMGQSAKFAKTLGQWGPLAQFLMQFFQKR